MSSHQIRLEMPGLGKDTKVDRDARMIKGFQVMRKGSAKGHGFEIDDTTLAQLLEAGQRLKTGARGHLGHGSFLGPDSLMTYLGRARNFRRDGDVVRADFQFSPAADNMPGCPGGATAILDLAEDDPESFGASVVVRGSIEEEDEGRKLRIGSLSAVDWVGEPAATTGVFSEDSFAKRFYKWLVGQGAESEAVEQGAAPVPAQEELTMATGMQTLDLSAISLEQIRQQRPDLVAALREEVKQEVRPEVLEEAAKSERERLSAHIAVVKEHGNPERWDECLTALAEASDEATLCKRLMSAEKKAREEQLSARREQTAHTRVAPAAAPTDGETSELNHLVQAELAEMRRWNEEATEEEAFASLCKKRPDLDELLNAPPKPA